jgi:hypothetical protein
MIEQPPQSPKKTSSHETELDKLSEKDQREINSIRTTWANLYNSFISEIQSTPRQGHAITLATEIRRQSEEIYKSLLSRLEPTVSTDQAESLALLLLTSELNLKSQDLQLPRKEQVFEMLKAAEAVLDDVKAEVGVLLPPFFTPLIEHLESPTKEPTKSRPKQRSRVETEQREKLEQLQSELTQRELIDSLKELEQWPPKHTFKPENGPRVFYPDKPFSIESSDTPRRSMVVYVDAGDIIKPRVIYGSSTHAVIKALPRVGVRGENVVWFDKADSEESISLGIPYQMKFMPTMYRTDAPIKELGREEKHKWLRDLVRSVEMGKQYNEEHRQDTFFKAIKPSKRKIIPMDAFPNDPRMRAQLEQESIPLEMYYPESLHLPDSFPKRCPDAWTPENIGRFIETNPDAYLPTLFHGAVLANLPRYGQSRVWNFESTEGTPLRYLIIEAILANPKERVVWVGTAERVKNSQNQELSYNTYLVPEEYENLNPITTPALEHYDNMSNLIGNYYHQTPWFKKFNCTNQGVSLNMWPFIKNLPVVKAFFAKTKKLDREKNPRKQPNR